MKKLFISSLVAGSTLLLSSCNRSEKTEETRSITVSNHVKQEEKKMARVKTPSGLEYEILKEGTGSEPKPGQNVTVHYTGWLDKNVDTDNSFDSSVKRGTPFNFNIGVGRVIAGWDEGVISMKVGEKRRLFIPSKLGYGEYGAGRSIPGNSNLVFDVELLKIG
ncbi:MAG: FKBP-type peptidyl-prolyl cis-trans isomerase [Candidatus Babeliales bacterium]|nr:FKBP-type peptidyl-prolyl cis-trans isomerase [Candidatus Babeliales bacterium]